MLDLSYSMTAGKGGSPLRVDTLTPVVTARPGTRVPCTVRVHNDGAQALSFSVRVVGLTADAPPAGVPWEPLQPGAALDVSVDVDVPQSMTPGEHAIAIEVMVTAWATGRSDVPRAVAANTGSRLKPTVALAPLVVKVASLDQVLLRTIPTMLRGRRGGRFSVEVINRRTDVVTVDLDAEAPTLAVQIEPRSVAVGPGDTVVVQGRVRAQRMWRGEERQHIVNVEGSGSAQPTYTRLVFRQRPVIARGIRGFTAVLVVLSMWAALLGGAAFWIIRAKDSNKESTATNTTLVDTNGDGTGDTPANEVGGDGTATGGDASTDAAPGTAPGTDPQSALAPTSTRFTGVVKAGGTGADDQVLVTLTALVPAGDGETPPPAQTLAGLMTSAAETMVAPFVGGVSAPILATGGKFWSARHGTYSGSSLSTNRATLTVAPKTDQSDNDGIWTIEDVPLRRNYEVSFSKEGFNTQSFLVTPPDDGSPLKLDVELKPAVGALSGTVTSGSGGLGGVDLTVTDGTLTFNTTTSTIAGEEGSWLIEGLSTPATYTVTAVRAGYGTVVGQYTLDVGKSSTNLSFSMNQGVGSIGGIVNNSKGPMGGVTLTATGGGITATTTSLTSGATGTYLFPELKIGGTYTITATSPGYITQTLVIDVGGNEASAAIDLVRTTATVIGLVTSVAAAGDTNGLPLPNAAVEIKVDALTVRASTAVSPDAGSFRLDELPPGTYTITFGRYDHLPDSRLITVTAGQELDLGKIALVYRQRQQLNPTGSVSVVIKRSSNNTALPGATITLTDVARRLPPITPAPLGAATSLVIPAIPVGVYELVVNVPNYRPFIEPRVAVGFTDVPVIAAMVQYGQAFGQVVDGLAPYVAAGTELISSRPLGDYRLLVYEDIGGSLVCAGAVTPEAPVLGRIRWNVNVDLKLLTGKYVLRFSRVAGDTNSDCANSRLPPGYAAAPDAAGNVAAFVVTDTDAPIAVADIAVFPFPRVTGVVLAPSWNGTATVLDPTTSAIAGLTVRLVCGALTANATIQAVQAGTDTLTTFVFDRPVVAAMFGNTTVPPGGVLGDCSVVAQTPTSVKVDSPLQPALLMPTSGNYDDRALAIVLADDPADLVGTVAWTDPGTGLLKMLGGVLVTAKGVTVGFDVGQATDTDGPGSSTVVPGTPTPQPPGGVDLTATSNGQGGWAFSTTGQQQVAGTSTYNVAPFGFTAASFGLLIDQGNRVITASSGFTPPITAAGSLDLRLQPLPGSIAGSVVVVTGSTQNRTDQAVVHATPPGTTAVDFPVQLDGSYSITPAAAGTWLLDYRAKADSNLVLAPADTTQTVPVPQVKTVPVQPGLPATIDPVTYWDLAQVTVSFKRSDGTAIGKYTVGPANYPAVTASQTTLNPVYPAFGGDTATGDANGVALLDQLSVDIAQPVSTPVGYGLAVAAAGFDLSSATYGLYRDAETLPYSTGTGALAIPVEVAAGSRLRVEVTLPKLGVLFGSVTGLLKPGATAPPDIEALTWAGGLQVTVEQVDMAGASLGTPSFPTVQPIVGSPDSFRVDGLYDGFYKVTYSHPDFVSRSVVYHVLLDTEVDASTKIDIATSTFVLTVVTDTVTLTKVLNASAGLWPAGTTPAQAAASTPTYSATTDAITGIATFTGVIPGPYVLIVRKADVSNPLRDGWFPVIATITAPRGADAAARTLSRRAVMPETQSSLLGTVSAHNLAGHPVPLPATITVDRTYKVPQDTGSSGLPNTATEANQIGKPETRAYVTSSGGATTGGYSFTGIAAGDHTLHFLPADGFDAVADVTVAAARNQLTNVPLVEFVARDRVWRVTITNGGTAVSGLHIQATGPDGSVFESTELTAPLQGTYEFIGIPPEGANYTIVIDSVYYQALNSTDLSVNIPPSSATKLTSVPVKAFAIITGSAFKLLTESTQEFFTTVNGVELVNRTTNSVVATATPNSSGAYQFVVDSVEPYSVRAAANGFVGAIQDVGSYVLAATKTAPPLNLKAYASVKLTVGGTPGGTAVVTPDPATGVSVTQTTPGVFSITGLDPDIGYKFDVSAPTFLSRMVPATGTFDPFIGTTTTLLPVVLEGPRTITGKVLKGAVGVADATVTLIQGATQVGSSKVSGLDGSFTFTDVGYGTYTITADKVGTGTGVSADVVVKIGDPITLVGRDVPITNVRTLAYRFSVTPAGATITFSGVLGSTAQVSFAIGEDASRAYTVRAPGYLTISDVAALPAAYTAADILVPVTLTANEIKGTITNLAGNVDVFLCLTDDATCFESPYAQVNVRSSNPPNFSFSTVPSGLYRLVARKNPTTMSADFPVSVDALTGAVTGSPVSIPAP